MRRIAGDDNILNFDNYRIDDRQFKNPSKTNQTPGKEASVPPTLALNGRRGLQSNQRKPVKDGVDIMQMDITREPSETESTLEFILNTLCRALKMKPKQSAALLTNNNQFLTHCVVKGVKSRYEPMISWYQEIYQYSRHLSQMLETEVDNALQSNDQKVIKASNQNFEKVLQTISCGCYSNNLEVAQLCLKTISCIAQDFNDNINLVELRMKWFMSKDNGIYTINYALRKHSDIAEEFVNCVGKFTGAGEQMSFSYLNTMEGFYPALAEYFCTLNQIFPFIAQQYPKELLEGNLLGSLVDKCIRNTDGDSQNSPQVRISSLGLLTEIWLAFPPFIEKNDQYNNSIQHVFKKNVRESIRSVRLVTATCMFKLLDKFSAEKNQAAPSLYKTLIFSLVESPHDQTTRELYLTNFQYLFDQVKSIPIGLLIDPFVKTNQVQDTFQFQTFDFDFFTFTARHPKLNIANSIQILDLLARLYLNDVCNASAAAVPFMMICSRFIEAIQCQEFILKFITISLNQLLQISNESPENATRTPLEKTRAGKQKTLALPAPDSVARSNSQMKGKDVRISTNKKTQNKAQMLNQMRNQEDEVTSRLKKSLIITMLLKLQNIRQVDVNNAMKDMLLGAQKQHKEQNNGYLSNGIMAVLKYWDDPDHLFNNYLKQLDADEKKSQLRKDHIERKMQGYDSEEQRSQGRAPGSIKQVKSYGTLKGATRHSTALVPLTENEQNLRAQHELDMIKKLKKDKEDDKMARQKSSLKKATLNQKRLTEELMKRRVEVGVHRNVGGVKQEIKALIYKDTGEGLQNKGTKKLKKNPMESQFQLVDLMEEEDRDREILNQFMKKYAKIWKFLFGRYANQAYSTKGKMNFDDMVKKTSQINLAELTKMLKEHNTYPQLLSRDELAQMIRLVNMHSAQDNSSDLAMLDYNQFLQFIPQLAFLCFSRPPIDKSSMPSVESLRALVTQFEMATRDRGRNTALYEDPDQSTFADKELIAALVKKLQNDPSYPVPEGFRKVIEKIPIYEYKLPECATSILTEGQIVATSTVDDLLFESLGIHFLEPQVQFELKVNVKPTIAKAKKQNNPAEALGYMKKADKNIEDVQTKKATAFAMMSAADKRKEALEVKPKLNLALKMQVTKQDLKNRPHYQEVAEVFEEMLQAAEKGLDHLPPRLNRAPGQVQNEVKTNKAQRIKDEEDLREQKDVKRLQRNEHVKKLIKETNFGGKGMPAEAYKLSQRQADAKEKEKKDKEDRIEFQKKTEQQKKVLEASREANIQELKKKKAEEQAQAEVDQKTAEGVRKEFLVKEKQKLKNQFKDTYKRRDELISRGDQRTEMEKQNKQRLKEQMVKYIDSTKDDRLVEKKERQDIQEFLDSEAVASLFEAYKRPLSHMYKFYASQDDKKDTQGYSLDYLHAMLDLTEFIRFGYHQKVTPHLITPEDMMFIYKNLLGESVDQAQAATDQISIQNRTSGMIDYNSFKKAIIRISIMAQSSAQGKLGGVNEDLLKEKLDKEAAIKKQKDQQLKDYSDKMKLNDTKKKAELDKLRNQFNQEHQQKQDILSKSNANPKESSRSETFASQRRQENKQYELDQAALDQEELFFQKWLKQRENLTGDSKYNSERSRSSIKSKPKDSTQMELDAMKIQLKEQKNISMVEIEEKQIRKSLDVNIISAYTIEAFFGYLGLDQQDTENEINKKLNASMSNRDKTSISNRSPSNYATNKSVALPPVKEQPGADDEDFDRQQEGGNDEDFDKQQEGGNDEDLDRQQEGGNDEDEDLNRE